VAVRLAAEGAAVVIGARREGLGEQAAARIRAAGGRALFVTADVTAEAQVANFVQTAMNEFGRLDGAFNNAGGVNAPRPVQTITGPRHR
jgi:NAD(P)-dependent dehydrogenase (short-subunit alcohol dehydrogenase family)